MIPAPITITSYRDRELIAFILDLRRGGRMRTLAWAIANVGAHAKFGNGGIPNDRPKRKLHTICVLSPSIFG